MSQAGGKKVVFPIRKHRPFIRSARALRKEMTATLLSEFGWTVRAGPFAGMSLSEDRSWGNDLIPQLFGYYEQQLFDVLGGSLDTVFVDIGAADGYWAVGQARSGRAGRVVAFEAREKARQAISVLADLNGVADRVDIRGLADADAMAALRGEIEGLRDLKVLIDVEGAEYDLLDDAFLEAMTGATLVIELHPWAAADEAPDEALVARAAPWFQADWISDATRDVSALLAEVEMPDYLRGVLLSEERARPQNWLVLSPR